MINALILKIHENKKITKNPWLFFSSGGRETCLKKTCAPTPLRVQRIRRGRGVCVYVFSTFSDSTQHQHDVIIELCNNLQERSVSVTTQGPRPGRVKKVRWSTSTFSQYRPENFICTRRPSAEKVSGIRSALRRPSQSGRLRRQPSSNFRGASSLG